MLNITLNHSKGHFKSVLSILHDIYKIYANEMNNESSYINYKILESNTIIEYIQAVLLKYVDDNGVFNDTKYFYEVFTKNTDIWGFLMCYTTIIVNGVIYKKDKMDKDIKYNIDQKIINGICRILIKYCYSPEFAIKPIDLNELVKELESLSTIAQKEENLHKTTTKTRNVYVKKYNEPIIPESNELTKYGFSNSSVGPTGFSIQASNE